MIYDFLKLTLLWGCRLCFHTFVDIFHSSDTVIRSHWIRVCVFSCGICVSRAVRLLSTEAISRPQLAVCFCLRLLVAQLG